MNARKLPYQHLSIRVPWHDAGWAGSICEDPLGNSSCLRLGRIAEERDDAREVALAGKPWSELAEKDLPPCASERAGFMSTLPRRPVKEHPYAVWNDTYQKFRRTEYDLPPNSFDCVPFRWMLRKEAEVIADELQLPYRVELEESVDHEAGLQNPNWIQHADNQQLLLDTFFSAVEPERTLAWIYAKETPLTEDPRRTLIGVGRVKTIGKVIPYLQEGGGFGSVLWERVIGHSIRPSMEDGFLMPYHEILGLREDLDLDPAEHAVQVPDEFTMQFSYGTEHVPHDAALALLLALDRAVTKVSSIVPGSWGKVRSWLSDRVDEVWDSRGPCPGLGAALVAFGIQEGGLLAYAVQGELADNKDPWPLVDKWLRDPSAHPEATSRIGRTMSSAWAALPEERRRLLKLLSRFSMTPDQAKRLYQPSERSQAGIALDDKQILENPYAIFEADRVSVEPVAVTTIDRGVFPADRIRAEHPLPEPSRVDEPIEPRRVRALLIDQLEKRAVNGDSLRSQQEAIQDIRDLALDPICPLSLDLMAVCADNLPPEIETVPMKDGSPAYQLSRLHDARKEIRRQIQRRRKGNPLNVRADWAAVIDGELGSETAKDDEDEIAARREKAAALEMLATSRVSVLVGAAGTGKTTLLRALASLPEVAQGGLLLLAPTGKARVRMQEAIGQKAMTLAQFLVPTKRYKPDVGRYCRSDQDRYNGARTVIVDESSMMTEETLDALLDAIEGYERLILVGDPRQLPPIGVGRPFVDIVQYLQAECGTLGFPRVGPSYAELTIPRRQISADGERADLLLAEWFTGGEPSPGADLVWDSLARGEAFGSIAFQRFTTPADLHEKLRSALAEHLVDMSGEDDAIGFQQSYGGVERGGYVYFNRESASKVEAWQILSPIRAEGAGVNELNRMIHNEYRADTLELARMKDWGRKIPQPGGPQEIVYGDKVINVRNKGRKYFYPKLDECLAYVANGEIGVVSGPFAGRGRKPPPLNRLNVAFSTQPAVAYDYWMNELGSDDQPPMLELAFALTIHKSQGSEFTTTFVVIPSPCRLLSRELLYTALTRHRERIVIFHQGDLHDLRRIGSATFSETAARLTNLFADPEPIEIDGKFLESNLIHKTRKGIAVRSKSEVIIADLLYSRNIEFQYEQVLVGDDGTERWPDFTIFDDTTGTKIYWEHLGMLHRPSYRRNWEKKLKWYRKNGVLPQEEGGGPKGTLVTTEDDANGSISSYDIEEMVDDLLG
jgi:hypothetical protein